MVNSGPPPAVLAVAPLVAGLAQNTSYKRFTLALAILSLLATLGLPVYPLYKITG